MSTARTAVLVMSVCACDHVFLGDAPPPAPTHRATVAAGFAHTCRLFDNGTLSCWGDNTHGQVGAMFDAPEVLEPVLVGGQTWRALAAGSGHTCAIDEARDVWCWGDNSLGQLGIGSLPQATPTKVLADVDAIEASNFGTCALRRDKTLSCWGRNNSFQLGDASSREPKRMPTPVHPGRRWRAVAMSSRSTCALDEDRALYCWGENDLGVVTPGVAGTATAEPQAIEPGMTWRTIVAGDEHVCGLREDGVLVCWGHAASGQLGIETAPVGRVEVQPPDQVTAWLDVFAGAQRTCATRADNTLWCWGRNATGELGAGDTSKLVRPTQIESATPWFEIALGERHACALDATEALWCTGNRAFGQLGDGSGGSVVTPGVVPGRWRDVSVGSTHVCARRDNGEVHCWGDNPSGQIGDGTVAPRQRPVFVLAGSMGDLLAAGHAHTCATAEFNTATKCWGANSDGEAGITPLRPAVTTPQSTSLGGVSFLSAGGHSCAITFGAQLACWGSHRVGQLHPTLPPDEAPHPEPVFLGAPQLMVGAGLRHTCIANGQLVQCWGDDSVNQLGPGVIPGNWRYVVTGNEHTCALDSTVTRISCWGRNDRGQVGDGTTDNRATPHRLETNYDQVAAGAGHTCAVIAGTQPPDDDLHCWGDNTRGQLGDGTRIRRTTPVPAAIGKEWIVIAAGGDVTCGIEVGEQTLSCWGSNFYGQLGDGNAWRSTFVKLP